MFQDLIERALAESHAQRLLFLFASAEESRKSRRQDDKRGTITPTMVVDKLPSEIASFEALVSEADSISKDWNFMFIAAMAGNGSQAPSSEEAEPYLNAMTHDVTMGQNIQRYIIFDRKQQPIELMSH
ncbi:MAG: ribonucleotide reductase subunit alpha [Parahaliea sp.]